MDNVNKDAPRVPPDWCFFPNWQPDEDVTTPGSTTPLPAPLPDWCFFPAAGLSTDTMPEPVSGNLAASTPSSPSTTATAPAPIRRGRGRPVKSDSRRRVLNARRNARRRALAIEKVAHVRDALSKGSPGAHSALQTVLQTNYGRKAFPGFVAEARKQEDGRRAVSWVANHLKQIGTNVHGRPTRSVDKARMVAELHDQGFPLRFFNECGISSKYVHHAKTMRTRQPRNLPTVNARQYGARVRQARTQLRSPPEVRRALVAFFEEETFVLSGARRPTRRLGLAKWQLMGRLHARWPSILRRVHATNPSILTNGSRTPTKLQMDIKRALERAEGPNFDEALEAEQREAEYCEYWMGRVARERFRTGTLRVILKTSVDAQAHPLTDDDGDEDDESSQGGMDAHEGRHHPLCFPVSHPSFHSSSSPPASSSSSASAASTLSPPAPSLSSKKALSAPTAPPPRTFWATLLDQGVRYTTSSRETRCPLHDNGPIWRRQLEEVTKKLAACNPRGDERVGLLATRRTLATAMRRYDLHIAQYATQRTYLQKLEESIGVGQAIVYRDFVNVYSDGGHAGCNQVKNLQLVVLWRETENADLLKLKLSNICADKNTQSCDRFYVADVFKFHMHEPDRYHYGFLNRFKKIYLAGDHGPHFSAKETVWHESQFETMYGVAVETIFLCSYHAFNRCDGAGVEVKQLMQRDAKQRVSWTRTDGIAHLVNTSNYVDHVAFPFAVIARNRGTFPQRVVGPTDIRRVCHITFPCPNVAVCPYPGLKTRSSWLCVRIPPGRCVNLARCVRTPRWHRPCPPRRVVVDRSNLHPARVSGPQLTSRGRRAKRRRPGTQRQMGKFPCKVRLCRQVFYKTPGGANRHMRDCHTVGEDMLYEVPQRGNLDSRGREGASRAASEEEDSQFLDESEVSEELHHGVRARMRSRRTLDGDESVESDKDDVTDNPNQTDETDVDAESAPGAKCVLWHAMSGSRCKRLSMIWCRVPRVAVSCLRD